MNRIITLLAILLLATSCDSPSEVWMSNAKRPIVLTAEDRDGSVVLTDADGNCHISAPGYVLSEAVSSSYSVGDTLKP